MDFDFRVYTAGIQAIRDVVINQIGWPSTVDPSNKIVSKFLLLNITPKFLGAHSDFGPYAQAYDSTVRKFTGHSPAVEPFEPADHTFGDFAELRTGDGVDRNLFRSIYQLVSNGVVNIPSLAGHASTSTLLGRTVTDEDLAGLKAAMDLLLDPTMTPPAPGRPSQLNPTLLEEFPNLGVVTDASAVSKKFGDLMTGGTE